MDTECTAVTSHSSRSRRQVPEVRIHQNPHCPLENRIDQNQERRPPPNWRTNMKADEKLNICRKYYIAGFFLLPIFWLVNFLWHYREAYQEEQFEEQTQIKNYVFKSGVGFLIWAVALTFWIVYFQTQRYYHDWDYLTFNFPTGSP
ncbi:gamma-secretase subunit PEN-2 [Daktulosphaira vitifoliae]|uniref:gamma-secretase subunit PEN-2 n=1 Tax=Daktulosphaira vitifoliae TaxID=58002 RepID=UPI0021AA8C83|nr:gamma-secretase subunit PEN-2 [Daktulosphaira vitifoliae]